MSNDSSFKIVVVGDSGVGKVTKNEFCPETSLCLEDLV